MPDRPNIALIGFMGAGKTGVANALARLIGMSVFDTDDVITNIFEMSIPVIFSKHGEAHFRRAEHELCQNLDGLNNTVVATGGGIVLDVRNIDALRSHCFIIYLHASPEKLAANLANDSTRPLLPDDGRKAAISGLLAQREHLYRDAADYIIDTDPLTIDEIAEAIVRIRKTHA